MTTMRMAINYPAPENTRYTAESFQGNIGKPLPVAMPNGEQVTGTLVETEVIDEGRAARLTLEVPDWIANYWTAIDEILGGQAMSIDRSFSEKRKTLCPHPCGSTQPNPANLTVRTTRTGTNASTKTAPSTGTAGTTYWCAASANRVGRARRNRHTNKLGKPLRHNRSAIDATHQHLPKQWYRVENVGANR